MCVHALAAALAAVLPAVLETVLKDVLADVLAAVLAAVLTAVLSSGCGCGRWGTGQAYAFSTPLITTVTHEFILRKKFTHALTLEVRLPTYKTPTETPLRVTYAFIIFLLRPQHLRT